MIGQRRGMDTTEYYLIHPCHPSSMWEGSAQLYSTGIIDLPSAPMTGSWFMRQSHIAIVARALIVVSICFIEILGALSQAGVNKELCDHFACDYLHNGRHIKACPTTGQGAHMPEMLESTSQKLRHLTMATDPYVSPGQA